jgi:hypothetical protein
VIGCCESLFFLGLPLASNYLQGFAYQTTLNPSNTIHSRIRSIVRTLTRYLSNICASIQSFSSSRLLTKMLVRLVTSLVDRRIFAVVVSYSRSSSHTNQHDKSFLIKWIFKNKGKKHPTKLDILSVQNGINNKSLEPDDWNEACLLY